MRTVDCRGMSCPLPVVTVKRSLEEEEGELRVLLDDGPPRENVRRFAEGRGYEVAEEPLDGGIALVIGGEVGSVRTRGGGGSGPTVVLISSDRLGDGPEELGRLLMKNYLITLLELTEVPDRLLFVNTGVLLTTEGSEVVEALEKLGNRGSEVLSCGVCLDFFECRDKLRAGTVTNMFTIAENLAAAAKLIRL